MNNYLIKNLIVILISLNLINQVISFENTTEEPNYDFDSEYKFNNFECNENTKDDLKALSLLIDEESNIYLETKLYLIRFRPPIVINNVTNVYSVSQIEYLSKKHEEKGERIGLTVEGQFIGTKAKTFTLKEIHNLQSSILETDVIFVNNEPKRIKKSTQLTNRMPENIREFKYKYSDLDHEFSINFNYDKKNTQFTLLTVNTFDNDPSLNYSKHIEFRGKLELPYVPEHSIFYLNTIDKNLANVLIEIDHDSKIHLTKLKFPKYLLHIGYDEFENKTTNDNLLHFLSCHLPFQRKEYLKGILFRNETYFIFVDRFYLSIDDDLMSNGFRLKNSYYTSHAKNIEIEKSKFSRELQYASTNRIDKLVKLWDENLYLIDDNLFKFKLFKNEESDSKILIRNELEKFHKENVIVQSLPARLRKCKGQYYWIKINKDHLVYCFYKKHYYLFLRGIRNESEIYEYFEEPNAKLFKIKDLFKNADFKYDDNQLFYQFFDYKFNKSCLFTQDHLYCVDKNLEPTEVNDNFEFYFKKSNAKYNPSDIKDLDKIGLFKLKNHIFEHVIQDEQVMKSKKNKLLFMILFGVIGLIIIVLLILLLFKLSKSKSSLKNTLLAIRKSSAKNMNLMVNKLKQLKSKTAKLATKKSSEKEIKKSASKELSKGTKSISKLKSVNKLKTADTKSTKSKDSVKSITQFKEMEKSKSKSKSAGSATSIGSGSKIAKKDDKAKSKGAGSATSIGSGSKVGSKIAKKDDKAKSKGAGSATSIGSGSKAGSKIDKKVDKAKSKGAGSATSIGSGSKAGSKIDKKVDKVKSESKGQISKATSPSKKPIGKAQSLSKSRSVSKESTGPSTKVKSTTSQNAVNKKDSKSKSPKK